MKQIQRTELPTTCNRCGAPLISYHSASPIKTRRICSLKCNGYHVLALIDHTSGKCYIDAEEVKMTHNEMIEENLSTYTRHKSCLNCRLNKFAKTSLECSECFRNPEFEDNWKSSIDTTRDYIHNQ